jgi:hypothetical protein
VAGPLDEGRPAIAGLLDGVAGLFDHRGQVKGQRPIAGRRLVQPDGFLPDRLQAEGGCDRNVPGRGLHDAFSRPIAGPQPGEEQAILGRAHRWPDCPGGGGQADRRAVGHRPAPAVAHQDHQPRAVPAVGREGGAGQTQDDRGRRAWRLAWRQGQAHWQR